jgi:hypothetical protein
MEGDPFFDNEGLEYLFGLLTAEDGEPRFTAIWGRDRAEEKAALEQFIDLVGERRRRFPDLHVYHYASYEVTALKRLAGAHGTREEELDQLLRDEVFVDLYKVVRESMLISQPSYSIKKVEAFYMEQRDTAVSDGGASIVMFEQWLEKGEEAILDEIAAYNRDDCLSTQKLRDWLLERREEAERQFEGSEEARRLTWFEPERQERGEESLALREDNDGMELGLSPGGGHPQIGAFVSELMYDGRLGSVPGRERQRIEAGGELSGAGLRWLAVEHEGRSQSSPEEAAAITAAIEPLLAGATYTDAEGAAHPLRPEDILVLTPYNAQVRCLQDHLPDGIRVGTVDKFQGQEAQIVFFSMATSSGEQIPRNVEFLFSRNRLNVAISRARCLAVLVCSPRLLDIHAKSIEQMRLVNALCRFGEVADESTASLGTAR